MKEYLIPLLIGIIFGVIDILPMVKYQLDNYSIISAFIFHIIMPIIVFNLNIGLPWWIKGGIIYLVCAAPTVILIAKEDKKSVSIVSGTSFIIGTIVSSLSHFFIFVINGAFVLNIIYEHFYCRLF